MYSHLEQFLGFGSPQGVKIHSGGTINVAHLTQTDQTIPCLLLLWWFQEPENQQGWYLPNKPKYCTLRLRQNRCNFTDNIFKWISLNENVWIWLKISLKFLLNVQINSIPALIPIMAWRRPGDKPLSESMMVRSLTHICVIQLQWVMQMS